MSLFLKSQICILLPMGDLNFGLLLRNLGTEKEGDGLKKHLRTYLRIVYTFLTYNPLEFYLFHNLTLLLT